MWPYFEEDEERGRQADGLRSKSKRKSSVLHALRKHTQRENGKHLVAVDAAAVGAIGGLVPTTVHRTIVPALQELLRPAEGNVRCIGIEVSVCGGVV